MIHPLTISDLTKDIDLSVYNFKTTKDLKPSESIIGQERAVTSLEFGLNVDATGYNLYVAGPSGIGKMSTVVPFVQQIASQQTTPSDWCYIYNFEDPYCPDILSLPSGKGRKFQKDMQWLIENIHNKLTGVFESDDYLNQHHEVTQKNK